MFCVVYQGPLALLVSLMHPIKVHFNLAGDL